MHYAWLAVFVIAGICSCQKCTLPTNQDLEVVIADIIEVDNRSSTPTVDVMDFHPVCLAFDDVQDHYRAVSVVINYTCTDNPSCPSGNAVEQIESECDNGVWSNVVRGATVFTRSQTTEASWVTSTRENCSLCVSPELGNHLFLITDSVTHCVGMSLKFHSPGTRIISNFKHQQLDNSSMIFVQSSTPYQIAKQNHRYNTRNRVPFCVLYLWY